MKHRLLTVLLSVVMLFAFAFGLTACGDGKDGKDGINGTDGSDGKDGVGVENAYIDDNGDLIIILTDGTIKNCGKVKDNKSEGTEGLYYLEIKKDGEVVGYSVRGYGAAYETDVVIPSQFNGKPVLEIVDGAFDGCDIITSITFPDSVVKIGEKAFYNCKNLKSVSAGSGLTEIGNTAFGKCENIVSVSVTDIAVWCGISFGNISSNPLYFAQEFYAGGELVTDITVPYSVKTIGDYAFYECESITSVNTGNGVTSIGDSAFEGCLNLKSVTTGSGVTSIGDSAFLGCNNLSKLVVGGKVKTIHGYAFSQCSLLTELTIPSSVESIGECAFLECASLKSVEFNHGLKYIGDCAFAGCISLEKFIMPDSVEEIGLGVLMFGAGSFPVGPDGSNSDNTLGNCLNELVISNALTEIPDFAFSKSNISTAVIGRKVSRVRYSSFYGCALLQSLVMPKSVTKIDSYAFYQCDSLTTVYYEGTAEDWAKISIGKNGNDVSKAAKYYYSETQPETAGNFWHYVNGVPVKW